MGAGPIVDGRVADRSGLDITLRPGDSTILGRSPDCGLAIDDPTVSGHHARLTWSKGWHLVDLGSRSGTFLDGKRVSEAVIEGDSTIQLGAPAGGVMIQARTASDGSIVLTHVTQPTIEYGNTEPDRDTEKPTRIRIQAEAHPTTIGRASDNSVVINSPTVSRHHAAVQIRAGSLFIEDKQSSNGTFINGRQITRRKLIVGDCVTIGSTSIHVTAHDELSIGQAGSNRLDLVGIGYSLKSGKELIGDIDLSADPGSLIAVLGPSGAGKSTLMNVITGLKQPTTGRATFDGQDIHQDYAMMRSRIGFVPQDDVIHRSLKTRQALAFGASLRLPADTDRLERQQLVEETLQRLGLQHQAEQRIDSLSGGQRKRASIGLELLTEPSLLVLDEPTSGLDPNTSRELMQTLRDVADSGRTVIVVTHSPADLDVCDLVLLLASGGLPAGAGSPDQVLRAFGTNDWRDVYRQVSIEDGDPAYAHERYRERSPRRELAELDHAATDDSKPRSPIRSSGRHFRTIARRQIALLLADRGYLAFLLILPIALGGLALTVSGDAGFSRPSKEAVQLLVIMTLGACFSGLALTIRDLVSERSIYRREAAIGLRPGPYLGAKVAVFSLVALVQASLLTATVFAGKPGPQESFAIGPAILHLFVGILLLTCVAATLGLFISALLKSSEQVMPVLVLGVMAQLVFCGGLVEVTGRLGLEQMSWFAPARWGYAYLASVVDIGYLSPTSATDDLWRHEYLWAGISVAALAALAMACFLGAWLRLGREVPRPTK